MEAHMHNLGQKYMGIRPEKHQDLLHDTSMKPASGHDVLVDNFLNAQCMAPFK
jgi:saccharopepsin